MIYKKLLFLAPFPDDRYPKNGMINRIASIDSYFKAEKRTYLYVSLRKNLKKYHVLNGAIEIFELNLFLHFFRIVNILFSAENIYSHSIHLMKNIWFIILPLKQRIILDAHGVVPEEIEYFERKSYLYYLLLLTERIVFAKKNATIVCVTEAMKIHFIHKYPKFKGKFLVFNIFPEQLIRESTESNVNIKQTDVSKIDKTIVLYSGGTAGWQNIELMLDLIEKNQSDNIEYLILTVEIEIFKKIIANYKINEKNIQIKSVSPNELSSYYKIADYGFILREDNIVNNVANPTKLIDYLFYGMIPIVLTPKIGDYLSYGYEYIEYDKFNTSIEKPKNRSIRNIEIAKNIMNANIKVDYKNIILGFKDQV